MIEKHECTNCHDYDYFDLEDQTECDLCIEKYKNQTSLNLLEAEDYSKKQINFIEIKKVNTNLFLYYTPTNSICISKEYIVFQNIVLLNTITNLDKVLGIVKQILNLRCENALLRDF